MSTNQDEDIELQQALKELVSEFEKALLKVELPKNRKAFDVVRKETEKLLAKVFENGAETKVIMFHRNDETTFPKQEGSYLAFNEANIGFVAFWAEFTTFRSEYNSANVIRKRRWITDYEVAAYSPIPLTQLCRTI